MAITYPMTPEQRAILETFTCERLTAHPDNRDLIAHFSSAKGGGLVRKLKMDAWQEDLAGSTAYYVIKNPKGQILLFFSLKCGALFDPDVIREVVELYANADASALWEKYLTPKQMADPRVSVITRYDLRGIFLSRTDMLDELEELVGENVVEKMRADWYTFRSVKTEDDTNRKMVQVSETISAVELVEFCANDRTKKSWKEYDMNANRMGETLFWYFVVKKMLDINDLVGSEYAYLFAADKKINGKLVSYYRDALHFDRMDHLGTAKPSYDRYCYFMGLRLRTKKFDPRTQYEPGEDEPGLDRFRQEFLDNFNENPEAEDFV